MKCVVSIFSLWLAFLFLVVEVRALEPSEEVVRISEWLSTHSKTEAVMKPWARDFDPPPQVSISTPDILEALSVDAVSTAFQRMAALALCHTENVKRDEAIRTFFKETWEKYLPYHVHPVGMYVAALKAQPGFLSEDLSLLVRMAVLESDGLAMASLGFIREERAVEVLVHAPFVALGDSGVYNANYQGLKFLCQEEKSRSWVRAYLAPTKLSNPRHAMVVLSLAEAGDASALESLIELVQTLILPKDYEGDPRSWAHNPQRPILAPAVHASDVLDICRSWGEPKLGAVLAAYIYAGSCDMEEAFAAATACGVKLDKSRLLALAAMPKPASDTRVILRAITHFLDEGDAHQVALLLAPDEWSDEDFYTRVLWIAKIPETVLTLEVRDALIAVAQKHPNGAVREWGIESLGRFTDSVAAQVLRQAEADGSKAAMRILCKDEADPGAAFLRRFTDNNASVREAAYRLVEDQYHGTSADPKVPGGLDPERRAIILKYLLEDWPDGDASAEQVERAVEMLYILVADSPLRHPAKHNPELAAVVVRYSRQTLDRKDASKFAYRLLFALHWAKTPEALDIIEGLAQSEETFIHKTAIKLLRYRTVPGR